MSLVLLGPLAVFFPLAVWMIRQSSSGFIDDHGREIINAQLTFLLTCLIPPVAVIWAVYNLVSSIRGAAAAGRREHFRYPMTFRPLG
jgi:uncharacterized Tic20 family protein